MDRGRPRRATVDVKGAKALSERLAEASREADGPPPTAVSSGHASDGCVEDVGTTATDGVLLVAHRRALLQSR
jgi:hypothetical protein